METIWQNFIVILARIKTGGTAIDITTTVFIQRLFYGPPI